MLTVFIGLILGTKKTKGSLINRAVASWAAASKVQQIVETLGHAEELPCKSPLVVLFAAHLFAGGFEETRNESAKELRFC